MTRSEIDAQLARHEEAYANRDAVRLAADYTEQGTYQSPSAGTKTGRAAIQKVYEYWITAFPDIQLVWEPPIVDGNRVAQFWHFRGTSAGPFFGDIRPGTRVEFFGVTDYVLSPDGIVSSRHLYDFTGALVSAGVLKVKPT